MVTVAAVAAVPAAVVVAAAAAVVVAVAAVGRGRSDPGKGGKARTGRRPGRGG